MALTPNRRSKRGTASLLALGLALGAGCAKERAPIDRTQPNALKKAFFVGDKLLDPSDDPEFYAQGTLIRVGYGAAQDGLFTSTYAQPVTRIKWVIQEDQLIGRLTYERIDGSDGMGVGPTSTDGQVAYVYKIQSHFDIRRAYNDVTGEELNVLVENESDRPWYEREYMRVDWSKNLNSDAYDLDTLSQVGVFGGVTYEPLAYYVNDPTDPDAPHFDDKDHYFDVTNKAFATPASIDLSIWGLGKFPLCFLPADFPGGSAPSGNCNPVELTIRQAFRKVTDTDYEPAEWDGNRFQAIGAFTTERHGYARNYGMSDDLWHRFISRYNIWERSHYYTDAANMTGEVACFTTATTPIGKDPHRDENGDGTEDECAAVGRGSRCDEFKQRCTLPFRDRTVKPIVWYYTPDSDPNYFAATEEAALQWDVAMRSSVLTARYTECMRTEKDQTKCLQSYPVYFGQMDDTEDAVNLVREVNSCKKGTAYSGKDCATVADEVGTRRGYKAQVIALAKQDPVVVLCHSPVGDADPAVCGEKGLKVRQGDLRYHQMNVIPTPQSPSPWGIMVDADDPLTGEKLAASVNVWSHVNDLWSQGVVDRLRYANGELSVSDVTEGTFVQDWVNASKKASEGLLPRLSKAEVERRLADLAGTTAEELRSARNVLAQKPALKTKIAALNRDIATVRADAKTQGTTASTYDARRRRAIGTETEAALDTKMMHELAGVDSLGNVGATTALSSPLQAANPTLGRTLKHLREVRLAERGSCIREEAPAPATWTGLSETLQAKFGNFDPTGDKAAQVERAERMRRYLAQTAHTSVILHEMGHSFGLRHNFVSSADAWGYRPQYWQLRTKNGAVTQECTDAVADGSGCVGPRWFDPMTDEERSGLINMFMQSTVMDYAGDYSQDMMGLGIYDFAAARMFYGDVVSVHADSSYAVGTDRGAAMLAKADEFGGILGFMWTTNGDTNEHAIHYSQLQKNFDLIQNCHEVDPQLYRPEDWSDAEKGTWDPLLDGKLVKVDGIWSRCEQQKVDYTTWSNLRDATPDEAGGTAKLHAVDPNGRTRMPYGFATDRWADLGNLAVYRHDNGADAYELFDFFVSEQEVNHIFDNYRRNRESFSVRSAVMRTLERYNEKMRDGAKGLGLFANIYRDFSLAEGYDFRTLWPVILSNSGTTYNPLSTNALAAGMAFDHFARQLGRPEAGEHYQPDGDLVLRSASDARGNAGDTALVVPNGVAGMPAGVSIGGRPIENALAKDKGEYDSEYTINAGSYYEKLFTSMLLTESVDNFISDSRGDFVDGRYRAVSMADVFPDGYRRWLSNNLTGDETLKAAWIPAQNGDPMVDATTKFPTQPLAWTSWWAQSPQVCKVAGGTEQCSNEDITAGTANFLPIDSEVGWEQQKFLIAWTLVYLPENQQRWWLDMMGLWNLGEDSDPGFANRIELHDPSGRVFIAKTFGKESMFGKSIEKGVAARMLQYANELLAKAYVSDAGPDLDHDGSPDWWVPRMGTNGQPMVKYDPSVASITAGGLINPNGRLGCNGSSSTNCTCTENRACVELQRYMQVPTFLRTALRDFGLADPSMRGLF